MVLYGKQSHLRWEERINDLDKEAFFDLSVEVYQVFDGDKRAYLHWHGGALRLTPRKDTILS
jgi:hypothetical protein